MSNPSEEPGLPSILKKLGSMTAIRDTYMVEQSLLRTLGPLLGVLETSLYRVDENGTILRALHHSRIIETQKNGVQRVAERVEEVTNNQEIPDSVRILLDNVRLLGKPCNRKMESDLLICYPLLGDKVVCGFFVIQRDREMTPVEDAIVHGVLEVFTNYFALLDTSQRDQLTGLLNRYSLEINLDRLWNLLSAHLHHTDHQDNQSSHAPQAYWLGIIDIDHFKTINDTYGHIIGDEVLIMVTRLLEGTFQKTDLLYRYGGEEFVAIIAANNLEEATKIFESARKRIDEFQFPQVGHVTISGGFSGADPSVLPQEVINRADGSLYAAKNAGRNVIYHYETLVKNGVLKEVASGTIDLF
jgi:diguanylate cyclase (GGDEF)-like protein